METVQEQRGCGLSGCCPPVKVTQEDVDRILAKVGGTFDDWFTRTNAGMWTKKGEKILIPADPRNPESMDMIAEPCIFMTKDGLCSVYGSHPKESCQGHVCECDGCTLCSLRT
jgi:exopolysaccharide biosynthesis protein